METTLDGHEHSSPSTPLLIIYSIVTCLLFGVHLLALMISRCVLSQIDAHGLFNTPEHNQLDVFIDVAWILSTGVGRRLFFDLEQNRHPIVLGIFLFLLEITLIYWVKFFLITRPAAIATTVIIVPILILSSLFSLHFYRWLSKLKFSQRQSELNEIQCRLPMHRYPLATIV